MKFLAEQSVGRLAILLETKGAERLLRTVSTLALMLFAGPVSAQDVLPFPTPPMGGKVGLTMQESVHKWREQPRHLPADAPNILIVMLDDAGFGQASTFGGETPRRSNRPTRALPSAGLRMQHELQRLWC